MSAAERMRVTFANHKVSRLLLGGGVTPVQETVTVHAEGVTSEDYFTLDSLQQFVNAARQMGAPGTAMVAATHKGFQFPNITALQLQFTAPTTKEA